MNKVMLVAENVPIKFNICDRCRLRNYDSCIDFWNDKDMRKCALCKSDNKKEEKEE